MEKDNLLLLHGALGCKAQFSSLHHLLSDRFSVMEINFEGHGDRWTDKEFSIELFAENALHFLLEKNIDKTHIFGYSMGGYVGLRLALQNPNIVDSIITLGTKFNWSRESAMQEIKMLDPEKIEENVPAYAKHMEKLHSGNDWKIVMKKTAKMMIDLGEGKRLNDDELRLIHHEVLICMGELDTMVTQEESVKTANLIPGGKFRMLEGVKHPIEKVDMHLLAKVIKDFIPMHP